MRFCYWPHCSQLPKVPPKASGGNPIDILNTSAQQIETWMWKQEQNHPHSWGSLRRKFNSLWFVIQQFNRDQRRPYNSFFCERHILPFPWWWNSLRRVCCSRWEPDAGGFLFSACWPLLDLSSCLWEPFHAETAPDFGSSIYPSIQHSENFR